MADPHDPIAIALAEDIGEGDLTSYYFIAPGRKCHARIFAKEPCVLAGVEVAAEVFARVDSSLTTKIIARDGTPLSPGDTALEIQGLIRSITTAERVALNFMQRLSGIATLTRRYVDAARQGGDAIILDTRKTTPGLRALEKAAVLAGGGRNHRMGLYDMVMVKDNHLLAESTAHDLGAAVTRFKKENPGVPVEIEADTLDQVRRFLEFEGVDRILLDNMSCDELRAAVKLSSGKVPLEASGGVSLATIGAIAATGVDYISVGALTHSARAMDFSLELLGE